MRYPDINEFEHVTKGGGELGWSNGVIFISFIEIASANTEEKINSLIKEKYDLLQ